MTRKCKTADYEKTLKLQITLRDVLPPDQLAHFIVDVILQLDLSAIYKKYADQGAPPYAPEILRGLLFYGYATGSFSSRKIAQATYAGMPFRFIAGDMHPDHDTIAHFRRQHLGELPELFVQLRQLAQAMGVLKLGNISLDGSKIHADASKSKAVSYKRLLAREAYRPQQVAELLALAEAADQTVIPAQMNINDEIERRQERLAQLAQAKAVLDMRAQARYEGEKAAYEEKRRQRAAQAAKKGQKPRGRPPKPPQAGPSDTDPYNFTAPDSASMTHPNNQGFDQHDNTQVAGDQESWLMVAAGLSTQPTDRQQALPTGDAIPTALGVPEAAALDAGYWSEDNVNGLRARGIAPYSATGRELHHHSWPRSFAQHRAPPTDDASALEPLALQLRTAIGQAI
jgi:transposase